MGNPLVILYRMSPLIDIVITSIETALPLLSIAWRSAISRCPQQGTSIRVSVMECTWLLEIIAVSFSV